MRPLQLTVEGFGPYRDRQVIDFSAIDQACFTGPNGAGKSTILSTALSYALFGPKHGHADRVVNRQSDLARVALTFSHDGENWRIERTRKVGKTKNTEAVLAREVDGEWEALELHGKRGVDEVIEEMLGVSREIFNATVLFAQKGEGRFATADPAVRKRILSEILGLDNYAPLAKAARQRADEALSEHRDQQRRIEEIDVRLADAAQDEADLATRQARASALESLIEQSTDEVAQAAAAAAEREGAERRLTETRQALAVAVQSAAAEQERLAAEQKRLAAERQRAEEQAQRLAQAAQRAEAPVREAEAALAALPSLREQQSAFALEKEQAQSALESIAEAGQAARARADAATRDLETAAAAKVEAEERLRHLSGGEANCFTCHQDLTAERRDALVGEIEAALAAAEDMRAGAESAGAAARAEREGLLKRHGAAKEEIAQLERKIDALLSTLRSTEAKAEALAAAQAALADAVRERDSAAAHLASLPEVAPLARTEAVESAEVAALREEIGRLEKVLAAAPEDRRAAVAARLRDLQREQAEVAAALGRLIERVRAAEELRTERAERTKLAESASADVEEYKILAQAWGPNGVPNLVFAGAAEELERDVSEMMELLTGGKYRLELRTQKVQAKGETTEVLDIIAVSSLGDFAYEDLSGGEQFRVDLAVQIGLTRLLVRRSSQPIEFLVIDEGWGSLDPAGVAAMVQVLNRLVDEFPLVLTITHTPEVAAAFGTRFNVVPEADGNSYIEEEAA